jgi:hypothetical protein
VNPFDDPVEAMTEVLAGMITHAASPSPRPHHIIAKGSRHTCVPRSTRS